MPKNALLKNLSLVLLVACCLIWPANSEAARAPAPKLLPRNTLAYARLTHVPELTKSFGETALGRMLQDPQMKPLVADLYQSGREALADAQQRLGLTIEELLAIPQGEITFALFQTQDPMKPGIVVLIDTGEQAATARKLLEKAEAALESSGASRTEEKVAGIKVVVYGLRRNEEVVQFERDNTFVICSNLDAAKQILTNWEGREDGGFSENPWFGAIMKSCRTNRDEAPQFTWFVDPIGIVRQFTQGNFAAQAGLAFLPAVGLDGLQAVGGTVAMAVGEYDLVTQIHLLLASPRSGALSALALGEGDFTPPKWIPGDVASYTSMYWDFSETYTQIEKLIDSFQGQGTTVEQARRLFTDRLGLDLNKEILPAVSGRVTYLSQVLKPIDTRGPASLLAIELKDPKSFQAVVDKTVERFSDQLEKKSFAGVTYYMVKLPEPPRAEDAAQMPDPCFAIAHDCLLISDRRAYLQQILTPREASDTLANSLEYKLIANKIARQSQAGKPGLVTFSRPEEGLRFWYEMAQAEQSRQRLSKAGENNKFFRSLDDALTKHPLPPFASIAKYLAPGGTVITNDETGFHYFSFTLRRK